MSEKEEKLCEDILTIIKDNLKILFYNHDTCLYYLTEYCRKFENKNFSISQELLTKFTEDALYALLNADFLYGEKICKVDNK